MDWFTTISAFIIGAFIGYYYHYIEMLKSQNKPQNQYSQNNSNSTW